MYRRVFLFTAVMLGMSLTVCAQAPKTEQAQTATQPPAAAAEKPTTPVQQDVAYGTVDGNPLLLDIYLPDAHSDLRPAVVLIHGGGWTSFDKGTMRGMGSFLARSGFVGFAVDYRLLHGTTNPGPCSWTMCNARCAGFEPMLRNTASTLIILARLDILREPSWRLCWGWRLPATTQIRHWPSIRARCRPWLTSAAPPISRPTVIPSATLFFANFLGGDYANHKDAWRDASPVFHVSGKAAPFLIFHGTHDTDVPIDQAQELADKLKHAGVPVKLVKVEDEHTFQTPEARKQLALESRDFFFQYLRPQGGK